MKILIACEESQTVCKAFRATGHEAYSCDLKPCSGGRPEWHILADAVDTAYSRHWDMIIAHPPCTDLAVSGARWFAEKRADGRQEAAVNLFMEFINAPCERIAVENPICIMSRLYRKPNQIIQPWQFGHGETKATCLWLKGLPLLTPTTVVSGREHRIHLMPPSVDRATLRSKTYQGIADAMATQWGCL